ARTHARDSQPARQPLVRRATEAGDRSRIAPHPRPGPCLGREIFPALMLNFGRYTSPKRESASEGPGRIDDRLAVFAETDLDRRFRWLGLRGMMVGTRKETEIRNHRDTESAEIKL